MHQSEKQGVHQKKSRRPSLISRRGAGATATASPGTRAPAGGPSSASPGTAAPASVTGAGGRTGIHPTHHAFWPATSLGSTFTVDSTSPCTSKWWVCELFRASLETRIPLGIPSFSRGWKPTWATHHGPNRLVVWEPMRWGRLTASTSFPRGEPSSPRGSWRRILECRHRRSNTRKLAPTHQAPAAPSKRHRPSAFPSGAAAPTPSRPVPPLRLPVNDNAAVHSPSPVLSATNFLIHIDTTSTSDQALPPLRVPIQALPPPSVSPSLPRSNSAISICFDKTLFLLG
ncbi:hypothetical protein SETIT_1G157100v2 [Setaria italica]|uniref:Uncharacterized protein n=1 Tax=Setaria italica TaxID=4555 RepID=A0A368PLJ6_SETIT|nr:uncharacterized protein LOC101772055 [Setaria italica]XP_022685584.1 uncharacterized protein LOC101772055 [Setaria italica]RCV06364.1 hypothetical protein SETIT_1G157100v2 [Setaria italica]